MVAVSTVSGGIGGSTIRTSTHMAPSCLKSVCCTAKVKDSAIICKGAVMGLTESPLYAVTLLSTLAIIEIFLGISLFLIFLLFLSLGSNMSNV
jgi:hypothetical protein